MKRTYILNITAFALVTGIALNQQALQARSETSREMEEGTAHGEEVGGPVGALFGGLLGAGVGAAKDTGDVVSGRANDHDIIIEDRYEDETMPLMDEDIVMLNRNRDNARLIYDTDMDADMDDLYADERSETAREMEKGAASGEEIAGPLGAIAGGIVGTSVGVVKDTGDALAGTTSDEDVIEEEILDMNDDELDMLPPRRIVDKNQLYISEVE